MGGRQIAHKLFSVAIYDSSNSSLDIPRVCTQRRRSGALSPSTMAEDGVYFSKTLSVLGISTTDSHYCKRKQNGKKRRQDSLILPPFSDADFSI